MNKSKSIKTYCMECGGGERANAVLCHIVDCPLWEHRIGTAAGSESYIKRITAAWEFYRETREVLENDGLTLPEMLGEGRFSKRASRKRGHDGKNRFGKGKEAAKPANAPISSMTAEKGR